MRRRFSLGRCPHERGQSPTDPTAVSIRGNFVSTVNSAGWSECDEMEDHFCRADAARAKAGYPMPIMNQQKSMATSLRQGLD